MIRAQASEKGTILTDLFHGLADRDGNLRQEYSYDGVHLTQAGYEMVAEIVLGSVPLIEKMELRPVAFIIWSLTNLLRFQN
jgi:lysophospholipase L1-like esterase